MAAVAAAAGFIAAVAAGAEGGDGEGTDEADAAGIADPSVVDGPAGDPVGTATAVSAAFMLAGQYKKRSIFRRIGNFPSSRRTVHVRPTLIDVKRTPTYKLTRTQ